MYRGIWAYRRFSDSGLWGLGLRHNPKMTSNPNPKIAILGHLGALDFGEKYHFPWVIIAVNLQDVGRAVPIEISICNHKKIYPQNPIRAVWVVA